MQESILHPELKNSSVLLFMACVKKVGILGISHFSQVKKIILQLENDLYVDIINANYLEDIFK